MRNSKKVCKQKPKQKVYIVLKFNDKNKDKPVTILKLYDGSALGFITAQQHAQGLEITKTSAHISYKVIKKSVEGTR